MNRVAVMGGGALGMLLAGRMAAAGLPTALWTRTENQARLIRERGLTLERQEGGSHRSVRVEAMPYAAVPKGYDGYVLVALKQTAITSELLEWMNGALAEDAVVVLFQNGIGHAERFSSSLNGRRLAAAVTTEGALRTDGTTVRHTGIGETWIGEWGATAGEPESTRDMSPAWLEEVRRLLEQAGFSVYMSNQIRERMLRKLLINAVINPLTALWRVTNGELPATPERAEVMEALFRETFDILRLGGLPDEEPQTLWETVLGVCASTSANRSSMLQDVLAGRETEIGALNGAISRMAEAMGAQAPWNSAVTALVKAIPPPKERGV